jgi:hypothetical protein
VPELVPADVAKKSGFKLDQSAPIATINELAGVRFQAKHAATIAKKIAGS